MRKLHTLLLATGCVLLSVMGYLVSQEDPMHGLGPFAYLQSDERPQIIAQALASDRIEDVSDGPSSGDDGARIDQLLAFFQIVVFGAEINDSMRSSVVAKWAEGLKVSLRGKVVSSHVVKIQKHLETVQRLTGVSWEILGEQGEEENVTILFVEAADMSKISIGSVDPALIKTLAGPRSCFFLSFKKPSDRIVRTIIVINVQRGAAAIDHCLLEEIVQSLGLPNDTDVMRPSIFSDKDRLSSLSRNDEILVRTLYDVRMHAGLDEQSAMTVAREIIMDWDRRLPQ